jgi:hypothetical protein
MPCGTRWIPSCARGSAACRIAQLGQPLDVTPGAFLALGQGAQSLGAGRADHWPRRARSEEDTFFSSEADPGARRSHAARLVRATQGADRARNSSYWYSLRLSLVALAAALHQAAVERAVEKPPLQGGPPTDSVHHLSFMLCVRRDSPETGTQPVRPRIDGCANDAWPNIMAPDRNCVPSGSTGCSAVPALAHHRRRGGLRGFIMSSGIRTRDGKVWFARRDEIARHWLDHNGSPS